MTRVHTLRRGDRERRDLRRDVPRGVVLLEVLVALTIFSVGVVAVLGGIRRSQHAVTRAENLLRASWLLDEVLAYWTNHQDAPTRGSSGAFEWSVEVQPWNAPESASATGRPPVTLRRVEVAVTWQERGHRMSVETVELVRGAPHVKPP